MKLLITISLSFFSLFLSQEKFFDPDGYYYPTKSISINGTLIEAFEVSTLDYYVNGVLDYEHPRFHKPIVRVVIKHPKRDNLVPIESIIANVTRDSLVFECRSKDIGVLKFSGTFLDKRGGFWDRSDIKPLETVVLSGHIEIIKNSKIVYSAKQKFTFSAGD
jgi:hypothetical protein